MSEQELKNLTAKQLDEKCKEMNLPRYKGKTHLNKAEMIENILNNSVEQKNEEHLAKDSSNKETYIEKAEVGTIIAFNDKYGNTKTGKILDRKDTIIHVELKSGRIYTIQKDDILWVRSEGNDRWPKDIFKMLKDSQARIEARFKERPITQETLDNLKKKMSGA